MPLLNQHPHSDKARLTLADGSTLTVLKPVIRGDSLFGNRAPGQSPVALALTSIRRVELQEPDGGKTALLAVDLGLTAAIVVVAVILASALERGIA